MLSVWILLGKAQPSVAGSNETFLALLSARALSLLKHGLFL